MARSVKATKTTKPTTKGRMPGPVVATATKTRAKARAPKVTRAAAAPKRASVAPAPAPKVSKDELRARVEKLESANATLRTKNREAGRTGKTAAARITELEEQVGRLEKQLAAQATASGGGRPASSPKGRRGARRREIDPGDSVPPGVAVGEPAPPDLEAETARENLEAHLGGE
ncbi:hypothetical protein [Limobrevibacterium gyesilva]|uniref:Uncharacterized protein n=1 Tax=Limobrevibacterium gyesilva TaxID=2991712 RepID=A0AA42CHX3_9PROT|nr:hypothetical protein [Limobrevibacterium gyesilva]MCW3477721.1 hypothetical protein [Limobrevibacterium gyesilva]